MRRITPAGGPLAGIVACAALVLSGCSDPGGAGAADVGGRGPITFVTGKDRTGYLRRLLDTWNEDHRDERVSVIELPDGPDARRRLVQDAAAGSGAYSVLDLDVAWTAEFAANRWLARLPETPSPGGSGGSSPRKGARLDLAGTLPAAAAAGRYRGDLYAMPFSSDAGMLYYRKDLLEKAGVSAPPRTYAQMWAACDRVRRIPEGEGVDCYLTEVGRNTGIAVSAAEAIGGAGGTIIGQGGRPALDTPAARRGLGFLAGARRDGRMPEDAAGLGPEGGRRLFLSGGLLFLREWSSSYALADGADGSSKVAGRFGVAPLPGPDGPGPAEPGGRGLAVSAFTGHKLTSLDFIRYLTGEAAQRANLLATSRAPALAALYDDPEAVRRFPYLPVLKAALADARPRQAEARRGDVAAAIEGPVHDAVTGRTTVDRALSDLQRRLGPLTAR
ncbi:extracellular solute-binding protein [Actinomadura graeca]|uniref:Extracellular solute-binding protein n=1 Tax=Actinomadura graeca TaxID=2750812 RepID=A0ABX8QP81_9ACTN|nr:extracellular solute-binding protein [Actinomadura graeca]QXJ20605.1 extracellular solute-binding protein [Actinomadura graeca]